MDRMMLKTSLFCLRRRVVTAALVAMLASAGAGLAAEETGTMDHPLLLSCANLAQRIKHHSELTDSPVIRGSMTVIGREDDAQPPMLLGCAGGQHIVCVMETTASAAPGHDVGIAGRISGAGEDYVLVDPCGVDQK